MNRTDERVAPAADQRGAAGTGRLVADLITGGRPYLDLGAFSLSRFAGAEPAPR